MASKLFKPNKFNINAIVSLILFSTLFLGCSSDKLSQDISAGGDQIFILKNVAQSGNLCVCVKGEIQQYNAAIKISCPDESNCISKKIILKAGKIDTTFCLTKHYAPNVLLYYENNYNKEGHISVHLNCKRLSK